MKPAQNNITDDFSDDFVLNLIPKISILDSSIFKASISAPTNNVNSTKTRDAKSSVITDS